MSNNNDIITNLRAIIISSKGGLLLSDVQDDYIETFGTRIPHKELGYKTLREFFEKNPSEFQLTGDKVNAVEKSNSAHITSLVKRQRSRPSRPLSNKKGNPQGLGRLDSVYNYNVHSKKHIKSPNEILHSGKEIHVSVYGEVGPNRTKTDCYEKIILRKPHDIKEPKKLEKNRDNASTVSYSKVTPSLEKNLSLNSRLKIDNGSQEKTDAEEKPTSIEYKETFENIKEFPITKSIQSRLWRQNSKLSSSAQIQETKDFNSDCSQTVEFFDLDAVSSKLPGPVENQHKIGKDVASSQQVCRQKAQARFAHIKSSMLMGNEVAIPEADRNQRLAGDVSRDNPMPETKRHLKTGRELRKISNIYTDKPLSVVNTDYVNKLSALCRSRKISQPSYKIIVREPKNEPKYYICKVHINEFLSLSSYPIETQEPLSAKEIAAKKMYNSLIEDVKYRQSSSNKKEIISHIMSIISPTYGVWSNKIPELYREKFNECLPKDWLNIVMESSLFEIDNFDGTRFIIRKKTDLASSFSDSNKIKRKPSLPESTNKLKELQLPDSEYWEIYITNVTNSDEIWSRLIGENYSDAYDALMTKLELEPPEVKATRPTVEGVYGVKVSAIWYRVRLLEIVDENQGIVFYIDIGDKDTVNLNELYEPEDVFFSVAPQAIRFSLNELESFSGDEELTSVMTGNLLGNTYIAQVICVSEETIENKENCRTITLWDTSTERDINVNQLLLNTVIKRITLPSLPNTAQIKEVFVSSINGNGDIYIQTNKKSVHHLNCLVFNKIKSLEGRMTRKANDTIGTDTLYLTKSKSSDIFCRTKVIEVRNDSKVDILFIDYGFIEVIAVSDLIHLEKSSILQAIPAQAVKVKLAHVKKVNCNIIDKLRSIILDQNVLMKVIEADRGVVPFVEFFQRSVTGNTLYSVNMKITSDPDLSSSDTPTRKKSVVVGLEKVLPKNLPAPGLPEIGQHFDVFVTLASSPDLFIVQPLAYRMQLMDIMNKLQIICSADGASPKLKEFEIGELYAVQHPDGYWYRGCVQAALGSYNYSIYLCDFGDCIMVTPEKIMPLPSEYKTLPYHAIRATLLGIPREQRDWTPVDCVTFHRLVVEKYFVSTLMEINRDEKNPNYVNLGLILTDTSGEEDVYIHKVLMEHKNEAFTFIKSLSIS